jgi:hypothetical protein
MDEKPFLEVNMLDVKENQIEELKKFHKSYFNVDTILESASELKYSTVSNTVSQTCKTNERTVFADPLPLSNPSST